MFISVSDKSYKVEWTIDSLEWLEGQLKRSVLDWLQSLEVFPAGIREIRLLLDSGLMAHNEGLTASVLGLKPKDLLHNLQGLMKQLSHDLGGDIVSAEVGEPAEGKSLQGAGLSPSETQDCG